MYKIYINDSVLCLVQSNVKPVIIGKRKPELNIQYLGRKRLLLQCIDKLEKTPEPIAAVIAYDDVENLFGDFRSIYKGIRAGGGLVQNERGEVLMIYRMEHWDLPKGKMDNGEKIHETALREVIEETGLKHLEIKKLVEITYHTYKNRKGKRVLKRTDWFAMYSEDEALIPQIEEHIEKALWMDVRDMNWEGKAIYPSILDVLESAKQ